MPTTLPHLDDVAAALDDALASHRAGLEDLVRIPSVSAPGFDPGEVRRAAEATRDWLEATGLDRARVLEVTDSHPAVAAEARAADPDAPTVLLYAHHDVQPPGDEAAWTSPPFEPTERRGRLYARGSSDDKAGIAVHVAAVDAWLRARGAPPCHVKVLVEGEEETGSAHLGDLLARYGEELRSDVIVVADSMNWAVGTPSLTYLLRGLVDCVVEVAALDHGLHSGMYGGPVPDALTALVHLLGGLVDGDGVVAVPGFADDVLEPTAAERARMDALGLDEAAFRADAGVLDGVALVGDPSAGICERLWRRPTATVIGVDAPSVEASSNTLLPRARARLSLRLAPGQDPHRALDAVEAWVADAVPWGLHARVDRGAAAGAFRVDPDGPAFRAAEEALSAAYGAPVVHQGVGGSIPLLEPMAAAFTRGGTAPAVLLTGVEDPDTRAHGVDESLHLADWRRACHGHAFLLDRLAAT